MEEFVLKQGKSHAIFDTVGTVVAQRPSGAVAYTLTIDCPEIARAARPVQFVNIAATTLADDGKPGPSLDMLLRRPLGFSQVRPEQGQFDVIYQVVGRGTPRHGPLQTRRQSPHTRPAGQAADRRHDRSENRHPRRRGGSACRRSTTSPPNSQAQARRSSSSPERAPRTSS